MPSFRKANNCSCCLQDAGSAGSGCLGLQLRNRTIVPRIPSSRGPEPPWAAPAVRYRPNNCTQSRQLPGLLGPDSPNNYSFSGQDGGWAASRHRTIIRFGSQTRLGINPKSEQWLVSAGLVVARSPIPKLWANPSLRARGTPASKSAILWALHYHVLSPMGLYGSLWLFSCVSGQLFEIPVVFPVFAPLSCYLLAHVVHEPCLQAVL